MNINSANYPVKSSNSLDQNHKKMSTGKRINGAYDDAAGLAIAEKLKAEINGLSKETDNSYDSYNMNQTKEGGLSAVSDSLQRIRELSLQATNSFMTDSDKQAIQNEIEQHKENISSMTSGTQFNTKNVLDGVFGDAGALAGLGIEDFDVTKDFSISDIDHALSKVTSINSEIGATMNRLDYTISSNQVSELNQRTTLSKIEDLDFAKATTEKSSKEAVNQFNLFTQKKQMEQNGALVNMLF